jgi:hypothetical protein
MTNKALRVKNICPHCGYVSDRVSKVFHRRELQPGAVSLCISCGEWSVFDAALALRAPTEAEFLELGMDAECRLLRHSWALMDQERKQREQAGHATS